MTDNSQINTLTNKKILVTGGAGFIGSNITETLLDLNNQVICLDNLATGFKKNIEPFFKNPNYQFIEGDICNFSDCEKAVKDVDFVLHQAALGSVPRSVKNPIASVETNTLGFVNILTAAKNASVERFIYASSSSVYGDNNEDIKTEKNTGNALSPYATTKVTNELFAENFSRVYDIETIGLRYFNVFGKNQNPNGAYAAVIPKFILQLLNHQQPTINNSDGSFSRDFTHVENVVNANILAVIAPKEKIFKDNIIKHNVFNIACGSRVTLDELFVSIKNAIILQKKDEVFRKIKPIYGQNRAGDIPHSLANIAKAEDLLNYKVKTPFDIGINKAVYWYIKNFKLLNS